MIHCTRGGPTVFANCTAVIMVGLLAGCIFERSQEAKDARTAMLGMSRSQVLACAGQPRSTVKDADHEIFTYFIGQPDYDRILGIQPTDAQRVTGSTKPKYCRVRILFRGDVVDKVDYSGNTGGILTRDEICASVVKRCLPSTAK
jgi:hypothetical protein